MKYFIEALKKYSTFSGRARRSEYWYYVLFYMIFAIAATILDNILGLSFQKLGYGPIYILFVLALFTPSLAISTRRLHDIGKSGWFAFIILIPIVGAIWLFVLAVKDSEEGENQYGPNPKEISIFKE